MLDKFDKVYTQIITECNHKSLKNSKKRVIKEQVEEDWQVSTYGDVETFNGDEIFQDSKSRLIYNCTYENAQKEIANEVRTYLYIVSKKDYRGDYSIKIKTGDRIVKTIKFKNLDIYRKNQDELDKAGEKLSIDVDKQLGLLNGSMDVSVTMTADDPDIFYGCWKIDAFTEEERETLKNFLDNYED